MGTPDHDSPARREAELRSLNRRRRISRHRSMVMSWMGGWLRRARRATVEPLPTVMPQQVGVCFAGHATVLVRYAGLDIACDPMLGSRVKGVRRAVRPGLSPADLQDVGLILISHAHSDHLHRATLAKLPRAATIVVPPRSAKHVSDLGFARVVELGVGQSVRHRDVDIFTAPARHGDRDHPVLSYVIRGDGPSVYFCGDSGYFSGFAETGRRHRPDIALLPIGGYAPLSFRERHLTPLDALYAFEDLQARVMIPIHYGSFALSYETLDDPSRWLAQLVRDRELEPFVIELQPGQSRVFVPPRKRRATTDGIPDAQWAEQASAPVTAPERESVSAHASQSPTHASETPVTEPTHASETQVADPTHASETPVAEPTHASETQVADPTHASETPTHASETQVADPTHASETPVAEPTHASETPVAEPTHASETQVADPASPNQEPEALGGALSRGPAALNETEQATDLEAAAASPPSEVQAPAAEVGSDTP